VASLASLLNCIIIKRKKKSIDHGKTKSKE
jgi:hypothetical protein